MLEVVTARNLCSCNQYHHTGTYLIIYFLRTLTYIYIYIFEIYFSIYNFICLISDPILYSLSDFILSSLIWSLFSLPLNYIAQIKTYFVSMLSNLYLYQLNYVHNHNEVILYSVLSDVHVSISNGLDQLLLIEKYIPA